jgi:hypothetical protein
MQDAHQNCRIRFLRLLIVLALGLVALPAHADDDAPVSLACESTSCLLMSDVMADGAALPGGDRLRHFSVTPEAILSGFRGFSGLVPCASFPVLPQAPPLA